MTALRPRDSTPSMRTSVLSKRPTLELCLLMMLPLVMRVSLPTRMALLPLMTTLRPLMLTMLLRRRLLMTTRPMRTLMLPLTDLLRSLSLPWLPMVLTLPPLSLRRLA